MGGFTGTAQSMAGNTSDVYTTPFPHNLGQRARDNAGNEYVFCDSTATLYGRQAVAIASDFTISAIGVTGRGPVGVLVAQASSDNGVWVQVYGKCLMQIIHSGVSASDAANGPTTLGTSGATQFWVPTSVTSPAGFRWTTGNVSTASGMIVRGISVANDAAPGDVSAQTSATSHSGSEISVFLNYPTITQINFGE
jgi:hypothetical protein